MLNFIRKPLTEAINMIWEKFKDGTYSTTEGNISIELTEKECIITTDKEIRKLSIEPEYNIMGNECLAFYLESEDLIESEFEVLIPDNNVCKNFVRVTKAIEEYVKESF
jgi:hypothetical protein